MWEAVQVLAGQLDALEQRGRPLPCVGAAGSVANERRGDDVRDPPSRVQRRRRVLEHALDLATEWAEGEDEAERGRRERDQKRVAPTVEQPHHDVAPVRVGAEEVAPLPGRPDRHAVDRDDVALLAVHSHRVGQVVVSGPVPATWLAHKGAARQAPTIRASAIAAASAARERRSRRSAGLEWRSRSRSSSTARSIVTGSAERLPALGVFPRHIIVSPRPTPRKSVTPAATWSPKRLYFVSLGHHVLGAAAARPVLGDEIPNLRN